MVILPVSAPTVGPICLYREESWLATRHPVAQKCPLWATCTEQSVAMSHSRVQLMATVRSAWLMSVLGNLKNSWRHCY